MEWRGKLSGMYGYMHLPTACCAATAARDGATGRRGREGAEESVSLHVAMNFASMLLAARERWHLEKY